MEIVHFVFAMIIVFLPILIAFLSKHDNKWYIVFTNIAQIGLVIFHGHMTEGDYNTWFILLMWSIFFKFRF